MNLRQARILVSGAFLALFVLTFADGGWAGAAFSSFQLYPALLALVRDGAILAGVGLAVIVVSTVVFGRVYCSSLCPLGTIQDLLLAATRKVQFAPEPARPFLRLAVGFGVPGLLVAGVVLPIALLDPYSFAGRVLHGAVLPAWDALVNLAASLTQSLRLYWIEPRPVAPIDPGVLVVLALLVGGLALAVRLRGRIFCNTLCPAGALLGLLSRGPLFRLAFRTKDCTRCGACARVCKTGCIDYQAGEVDESRCVRCFNCLAVCPRDALVYVRTDDARARRSAADLAPEPARRETLARGGRWLGGLALAGLADRLYAATTLVRGTAPVAPPGAESVDRFRALCTACHRCAAACPTHVIRPTFFAYGPAGIFQPKLDYSKSFCSYECTVCTQVCPTRALVPLTNAEKKRVQLGRVVLEKKTCIPYKDAKDCGACAEHCPTQAVRMVRLPNGIYGPVTRQDTCVGCGICEHACPTTPKSIWVEALAVHGRALLPAEAEKEKPVERGEAKKSAAARTNTQSKGKPADDFPF